MDINNVMKILDEKADGNILFSYIDENEMTKAVQYIIDLCGCDETLAKSALVNVKTDYYDEVFKSNTDLSPQEIAHNNAVAQELLNKPKCPTCNSTNVKKIGGLERAGSVYMFGIFSKKINKSFECKNCGYTW